MKDAISSVRTLAVVLGACLAGCTAFREGKTPPVEEWPPPPRANREAINVEVSGNVIGGLHATWTRQAVTALQDSGLFSEVTASSRTDAPLRARVAVAYRNDMDRAMMALSGFTLFVLPLPLGTGSFDVETTFFSHDIAKGSIKRSETCAVWGGALSFFLVPFGTSERASYYDAMRSTIVEAIERGIL